MTDFPDLKIKALVSFPAAVYGGTGLAVRQENGKYYFDLDFSELAPVASIPTPAEPTTFLALWESTLNSYSRMSITDLKTEIGAGGGVPSDTLPLMDAAAVAGVLTTYARGDHVHPTDTSRAAVTAIRTRLAVATTFYVRTDGNDANNGLTNTAGGAFRTWQAAYDKLAGSYDLGGQNVTILGGNAGTYTAGIGIAQPWTGGGTLMLDGGGCTLAVAGGNAIRSTATLPGVVTIQNFTFAPTGPASHITNGGPGIFTLAGGLNYGNANAGDHITANSGGAVIQITASYTVSGSHRFHLYAAAGGRINMYTGVAMTVTVTASYTMAASGAWAFTELGGLIQVIFNLVTFSLGAFTVTGQRYVSNQNGVINTQGGGINFFPGTVAGAGTNSGVSPYGLYT